MVGRIDEEPPEVRALQLVASKEIAAAQERLRLEAEQLAGPPEQCVAIMRAVCEAQQAAQLQLTVIIKRHRPSTLLRANLEERLANMARQLEVSAAVSRLADGVRESLPKVGAIDGQPHAAPRSSDGDLRCDFTSTHDDTREEMRSPSMPLAVIIKAGTSLALLLVTACAGLVLFFLFASLPGIRPHREVTAKQAMRERDGPVPRPEGQLASAASSPPVMNPSAPMQAAPLSTISIASPNPDVPAARLPGTDPLPSQPAAVPMEAQPQ